MEDKLNINNSSFIGTLTFVMTDKEIYPVGVDYGTKCLIVLKTKNYLIFKVPSHNYWAGIGVTGFAKTCYYIAKIDQWPDVESHNKYGGPRGYGNILISSEPGSNWKKFLEWASEYINKNS